MKPLLLLLALSAIPLLASFEDAAKRAKEARIADRLEESVEAYREALGEKPDWLEGRWFLAAGLYQLRRFEEAIPEFAAVNEGRPETGAAWILRGVCEYRTGKYDDAFEHLRRGRSLGAATDLLSMGGYHLALLMNRFGEFQAASQLLTPFAADNKESPAVMEALGLSVLRKRWLPDEIPDAERPKVEQAGRAAFYLGARRAAEGRSQMEALLADHPDDADVRYAYATMLIQSDPAEARAQLEQVLAAAPEDHHANLVLGTLLSKERDYDAALPLLEKANETRPESILPRYQIAVLKLATGAPEQARGLLEEITREAYEFTGAHVSLATAYYRLGLKEQGDREREIVRELNAQRQAGEPGVATAGRRP